MDIELLRYRAAVTRAVRAFFDRRGYLETDTPLLAPALIPESCLEVFETRRLPPPDSAAPEQPHWLIPSPELWMKKLIAQHRVDLYQICRCFRNGESSGRHHSPEFTMLEYYTMNADYQDSLRLTEELFDSLTLPGGEAASRDTALRPPFDRITVAAAFGRWAGCDLYDAASREGGLEAEARRLGLRPPPGLDTAALYDLIFVHAVEPAIPRERPLILMDYPAFVPCLARPRPDGLTVERWELYVRGVELANCYSEETDSAAVSRFFAEEAARKTRSALVPHRVDEAFPRMTLPRCSGVALGMDRLIMTLAGRSSLDMVLPFP